MSILFSCVYFLVALVVALVLTFALVIVRNYVITNKEKIIRSIKFFVVIVAVVTVLLLAMAIIPPLARAEWIETTVVESVPSVYEGEKCYLVTVNINGERKSYYSSQDIPEETVIEVDYVNGRIENSREPGVFCFPPIMLLGAVAPIVRKKKIIIKQKMCPDFFMTKEKYEKGTKQHISIDLEDSRAFVFVYNPDRTKQVFAIPSGVEKAISEATRISPAAFVTAFVPAYGHQAVVFCNYHEHLGIWINTPQSEKINAARKLLTSSVQVIPPAQKVGKGGKDDPCVMMVLCTIDEDPKQYMYTFRTVEALNIGDRRTAKLKSGERKSVTVKQVLPPCFASQLDHPLDWYVTLEVFLLKEHEDIGIIRRIPANGVLTEEEMAEAQKRVDSMRCANSPLGFTGYDETDPDW